MKTSQNGINLIKSFEGIRLTAYKPVKAEKYWTIGYGHYGADIKQGMVISETQAENYLKQDLLRFENAVNSLNRSFNQNEFDALVSFSYNCGESNLKSLCKNRNNNQIADALLLYNKSNGKVLLGLTKRRQEERELFLKTVENEQISKPVEKLPYKVKTKCELNIRTGSGATYPLIRKAKKGEELTVWAVETNGKTKWGKNGKEYFCLSFCEKVV